MYPHRIRLRGPWTCEPLAWSEPADRPRPPACTMTLPCRWSADGLPGFAGRARLSRRFGYPGRIDAHERVWLTCAGLSDHGGVWLNGHALGTCRGSFEFEVTSLLQPRNQLAIEVEGPAEEGGIWGEVALEVRCLAFLRDVRVWRETSGAVNAAGTVSGAADGPLELYVILGRRPAAYATVTAHPEGTPFHLTVSAPPPAESARAEEEPEASIRIDLVKGATVWYTWEQPFPRATASHSER